MKLHQLMDTLPEGVDCGLVLSDINRRYLTGFRSSAGILAVTREKSYLFIDFRYFERAQREISGCEVVLLLNIYQQLADIFAKHNVKRVAVENYSITLDEFQTLKSNLKGVRFVENTLFNDTIDCMRMLKTPEEIDKILAAQAITEQAFDHICGYLKVGVTEKQVAYELDSFMRAHGADDIAFDTIAVAGENSSSPHGVPTDRKLREGDLLTMDFGTKLGGYHSDMTRTVAIGSISEEAEKLYNTVLQGQQMALEFLRDGQQGKQADKLVRDFFDSEGYEGAFGHSLGHGVGLEIHESPNLSLASTTVLREGMVVTVEPGLYLPGKFGVRIEDMVVITPGGCRNLTRCSKALLHL